MRTDDALRCPQSQAEVLNLPVPIALWILAVGTCILEPALKPLNRLALPQLSTLSPEPRNTKPQHPELSPNYTRTRDLILVKHKPQALDKKSPTPHVGKTETLCLCVCVCMYVCPHVYICVYVCVCAHILIYTNSYVRAGVHTYPSMCTQSLKDYEQARTLP